MSNQPDIEHLLIPTLDGSRRENDGSSVITKGEKNSGSPLAPNFRSRNSDLRDGTSMNADKSPRSAANHDSFQKSQISSDHQADEEDEHDLMMISVGNLDIGTGANADIQADDIFTACKIGDEDFVRNAIKFDPLVIHEEQQGRTPLCLASFSGHQNIMRLLLDAGARDHDGNAYICALNEECRQILNQYHAKQILANSVTLSPSFKSTSSVHSASHHRSIVATLTPPYLGPESNDQRPFDVLSEVQLTPVATRDHIPRYDTPETATRGSRSREAGYVTPDPTMSTPGRRRSLSRDSSRRSLRKTNRESSNKFPKDRNVEQGYETDSEERARSCGYPTTTARSAVDNAHASFCSMGSDFILALASYSLGCCADDDWITRAPVKALVISDEDSSIAKPEESVLDTEESESLCESYGESVESEADERVLEKSLSFKEVAEITLAETRDSLDQLKAHILGLYAKHLEKQEKPSSPNEETPEVKHPKRLKRFFKRTSRDEKQKIKLRSNPNDIGTTDQSSRSIYRKKSVMDKKGVFSVFRQIRSKRSDSQQTNSIEASSTTDKTNKVDNSSSGLKITVVAKNKDPTVSGSLATEQTMEEEPANNKSRRWWIRQNNVEIDNLKSVKGRRKRKSRNKNSNKDGEDDDDDDTMEADQSASSLEVYEIMTPLSLSDMAEVTYDETKKNFQLLHSSLCGAVGAS